jgi:hypothetical protein
MIMTQYIYLYISLFLPLLGCKNEPSSRCSDPFAINFEAQSSSGICTYPEKTKPPVLLANLNNKLNETSGLALIDGYLLTHNDQGNTNELYLLNPENGTILKTFTISGATNNDWEELAQSSTHVYIGDMGNNDGDRTNLKIYKVAQSQLKLSGGNVAAIESTIQFKYPEQQSIPAGSKHNFDCEAMVYHANSLYLFTKNRADSKTNLYRLPDSPGLHDAELIGSFESGIRITGADISNDGKTLWLIAYDKSGFCLIWKFSEFTGSNFFNGKKEKIILGTYNALGQMEAIKHDGVGAVYITSEKTSNLPPRLYKLEFD